MNFLAHLHIAQHCQSDLQGNLLGDFVKGDPSGKYPTDVVNGIRLHRFVDKYTDTHPQILALKMLFPKPLKRFAPIALDMFWDHCLAKHWSQFHTEPLKRFIEQSRSECQHRNYAVPASFITTTNAMWQGEWLLSYQDLTSIQYALERMSHRSERMTPLAECGETLETHYEILTKTFLLIYPEVLEQAKIFAYQQSKV